LANGTKIINKQNGRDLGGLLLVTCAVVGLRFLEVQDGAD
jgi:hypothetical protein